LTTRASEQGHTETVGLLVVDPFVNLGCSTQQLDVPFDRPPRKDPLK
jgi:hypothetical protein